jgi:UDP-N-acetylmuramyl pentapeptide synthase
MRPGLDVLAETTGPGQRRVAIPGAMRELGEDSQRCCAEVLRLRAGNYVLVKGSRSVRLERVEKRLREIAEEHPSLRAKTGVTVVRFRAVAPRA